MRGCRPGIHGKSVLLQIRNTKFGKSRLVPFGTRLSQRLRDYRALREDRGYRIAGSAPLFSWNGRSAIATNSIRNTFRDHLVPRLALDVPAGSIGPRVHGLRHFFAVRTLLRWYRDGENRTDWLHYLSTFLGHVNPNADRNFKRAKRRSAQVFGRLKTRDARRLSSRRNVARENGH